MNKLRPSEICWPVQGPTALSPSLTRCVGPARSLQGQQSRDPQGQEAAFYCLNSGGISGSPTSLQPRLPQQPHSRHSAQARRRLVLREETLKRGLDKGQRERGQGLLGAGFVDHSGFLSTSGPPHSPVLRPTQG